jgi:hypothetical protein
LASTSQRAALQSERIISAHLGAVNHTCHFLDRRSPSQYIHIYKYKSRKTIEIFKSVPINIDNGALFAISIAAIHTPSTFASDASVYVASRSSFALDRLLAQPQGASHAYAN